MKRKHFVRTLLLLLCGLLLLFLVVVGPWPAYRSSGFESRRYFNKGKEELSRQLAGQTDSAGMLQAGWASEPLVLPEGTPLAGYGDRRGKRAEGSYDALHVKALCLDNTYHTVILFASDLLIVPQNVAEKVRRRLSEDFFLPESAVLFNASHTHAGPGGGTRGLVARLFAGRFRRDIERAIIAAFVNAAAGALDDRETSQIGWGDVEVSEFIRNRTRSVSVYPQLTDRRLNTLLVRKTSGESCLLVRYSAHPTVIGSESALFSGDFPGFLQSSLEDAGIPMAMYLAGAVGSMGPRVDSKRAADRIESDYERARDMGRWLAAAVLESIDRGNITPFRDRIALRSVGFSLLVPPLQLRISPRWRLSPIFLRMAGLRRKAWLTAVSLDELLLMALPCDLSGEISGVWRTEAEKDGIELVPLSFNGAYVGYLSPDAYYGEVYDKGKLAYETAIMSWCGPDQEAYFQAFTAHVLSSFY